MHLAVAISCIVHVWWVTVWHKTDLECHSADVGRLVTLVDAALVGGRVWRM